LAQAFRLRGFKDLLPASSQALQAEMMFREALVASSLVGAVSQQIGAVKKNHQLSLPIEKCNAGGCKQEDTAVTLDANWRWVHEVDGYTNCFEEGQWSNPACSESGAACASACAIEGITKEDWSETYGISERPGGVRVKFSKDGNVGSRFYLLDPNEDYKQFKLLNREITFDVDVSTLPCGMNGAVYFSAMAPDGGKGSSNPAGAAYGTGYCDAQCPADVKFISGEANSEGWGASARGKYGSCCAEMDLWEANQQATAYTAHPCAVDEPYRCEGAECKTICDMPGCDFNSFRMGAHKFYGPGEEFAVNTLKPFTIVTQFHTTDGTDDGDLAEIRRFYVQDGKRIENSKATLPGLNANSLLSDAACALDKHIFGEEDTTRKFGGMKQMGKAIDGGMTLVLSLWDDGASKMHWLDSINGDDPAQPGALRGPCSPEKGDPSYVRAHHADAYVDYFNFKYGEIGSTTNASASSRPSVPRWQRKPQREQPKPQPEEPGSRPAGGAASKCCWGGCGDNCAAAGTWCAEEGHCAKECGGQWCPIEASLGQVKHHKPSKSKQQLRGGDHIFFQKLLKLSSGKQAQKSTEL